MFLNVFIREGGGVNSTNIIRFKLTLIERYRQCNVARNQIDYSLKGQYKKNVDLN